MNLNGAQLKTFQQALLAAFPTRAALAEMLLFELDTSLDAISEEPSLAATVLTVLRWAQAQGKLLALGQAALAANPGNPDLAAVAAALGITEPLPSAPDLAARVAELEAAVASRDAEITALRAQLASPG